MLKKRKETLFSQELQKLKARIHQRHHQLKIVSWYDDPTLRKNCWRVCRQPLLLAPGYSASLISFTDMSVPSRYGHCKNATRSVVSGVGAKLLVISANKLSISSWFTRITRWCTEIRSTNCSSGSCLRDRLCFDSVVNSIGKVMNVGKILKSQGSLDFTG